MSLKIELDQHWFKHLSNIRNRQNKRELQQTPSSFSPRLETYKAAFNLTALSSSFIPHYLFHPGDRPFSHTPTFVFAAFLCPGSLLNLSVSPSSHTITSALMGFTHKIACFALTVKLQCLHVHMCVSIVA